MSPRRPHLMSFRPAALAVAASVVGAACATIPTTGAETAASRAYPSLERVCVPAGSRPDHSAAGAAYRIESARGRSVSGEDARDCFFPWVEAAGWARVQSLEGRGKVPRAAAIGLVEGHGAGGASFELGDNRAIAHGLLGGPVEIAWTWDEAGRALARIDFAWSNARVSVGGRLGGTTRVHLGRVLVDRQERVWESTVFADADARGRLQEAHVADGPLVFPRPKPHPLSGIHPICPLWDREVWEDFDGRMPRVQRCLRQGMEWLRVERDPLGRITSIYENPAAAGGPKTTRTIQLTWHEDSAVPSTVQVARDGVSDGLEARFDEYGVPELTRHHRLGHLEGLEVEWEDVRARTARLWVDGAPGPSRTIIQRSSLDLGERDQPEFPIDLPIRQEPGVGAAAAD